MSVNGNECIKLNMSESASCARYSDSDRRLKVQLVVLGAPTSKTQSLLVPEYVKLLRLTGAQEDGTQPTSQITIRPLLQGYACQSFPTRATLVILQTQDATAQMDPLSVAGTGVVLDQVFQRWSDRLDVSISKGAEAGSMVSSAACRNAKLSLSAARQQLHDEMNHQWDRLGQEKLDVIRSLDKMVSDATKNVTYGAVKLDELTLDVEATLDRIPLLAKAPSIRRIEGASQFYKSEGFTRWRFEDRCLLSLRMTSAYLSTTRSWRE